MGQKKDWKMGEWGPDIAFIERIVKPTGKKWTTPYTAFHDKQSTHYAPVGPRSKNPVLPICRKTGASRKPASLPVFMCLYLKDQTSGKHV